VNPLAQFAAASPSQPLSHPSVTNSPSDRLPYAVQWNLTVQRNIERRLIEWHGAPA